MILGLLCRNKTEKVLEVY